MVVYARMALSGANVFGTEPDFRLPNGVSVLHVAKHPGAELLGAHGPFGSIGLGSNDRGSDNPASSRSHPQDQSGRPSRQARACLGHSVRMA